MPDQKCPIKLSFLPPARIITLSACSLLINKLLHKAKKYIPVRPYLTAFWENKRNKIKTTVKIHNPPNRLKFHLIGLFLENTGCMQTHGGTSMGACCIFPFIYRGSPQHRCTRAERGYRWCSSTSDYDKDKLWGFCAACFLSHGGNSNGNCCHFPFVYKGTIHPTCTTHDASKPWCATTYNYDIDKQWGYCGGKVKKFHHNFVGNLHQHRKTQRDSFFLSRR